MVRQFTLQGTPTGFSDGKVDLTGVLEFQFDDKDEKLVALNDDKDYVIIRDMVLSRPEFNATTGKKYKFGFEALDITTRRVLEWAVGDSRGYRDTVHVQIRLIAETTDLHGPTKTILDTEEIYVNGNRYFEPPL
jgi:hypothetical protein